MSTVFIFVLALFLGDDALVGTNVNLLRQFDSHKDCQTYVEKVDVPKEVKNNLVCLVIVKPDVYNERDEI